MLFVLMISVFLTATTINGNPVPNTENVIVLSKDNLFKDDMIVYTSQNKIVNLVMNMIGDFESDDSDEEVSDPIVFFNQISVGADGIEVELGQFVWQNNSVHKVFNGRAATLDFGKPEVYFGSKDGLYTYNNETRTAEKYGTITDNIIHLDIANGTEEIYILTEPEYRIYKVSEKGTLKTLVEAIPSARAFVLDRQHNIYYYGEDNLPYVLGKNSNKPIKIGSFTDIKEAFLIRPPFVMSEPKIPFLADRMACLLHVNGTSQLSNLKVNEKLTAISMEGSLLHYYGIDGNIYQFNILETFFKVILGKIDEVLTDIQTQVNSLVDFSNNNI